MENAILPRGALLFLRGRMASDATDNIFRPGRAIGGNGHLFEYSLLGQALEPRIVLELMLCVLCENLCHLCGKARFNAEDAEANAEFRESGQEITARTILLNSCILRS